ncbi:MAG: CAP domain-containing protein [Planctomycetes bacterium]|nr:CAP domain-containing protein [Planctomycetota bacterium]MCR4318220.1 CAP domain-containing protein [Planctomycetota bacterium]
MKFRAFLASIGILGLFAISAMSEEMSLSDIRRAVRSDSSTARAEAYSAIDKLSDTEKPLALDTISQEYQRQAGDLEDNIEKFEALFGNYKANIEATKAIREAWEAQSKKTLDTIFDTVAFPNPNGPVSGPYIGYDFVAEQFTALDNIFRDFKRSFEGDLRAYNQTSREAVQEFADKIIASRKLLAEFEKVLKDHSRETPRAQPEMSRFLQGMMFLKLKDWRKALLIYHGFSASGSSAGSNSGAGVGQGAQNGGAGGGGVDPMGNPLPGADQNLPGMPGMEGGSYGARNNPFWQEMEDYSDSEGTRPSGAGDWVADRGFLGDLPESDEELLGPGGTGDDLGLPGMRGLGGDPYGLGGGTGGSDYPESSDYPERESDYPERTTPRGNSNSGANSRGNASNSGSNNAGRNTNNDDDWGTPANNSGRSNSGAAASTSTSRGNAGAQAGTAGSNSASGAGAESPAPRRASASSSPRRQLPNERGGNMIGLPTGLGFPLGASSLGYAGTYRTGAQVSTTETSQNAAAEVDWTVEPGPALEGYERVMFFMAVHYMVNDLNKNMQVEASRAVRDATEYNNWYRAQLMMSPLQIQSQVTQAMIGHLEQMAAYDFFGHDGKTPETRDLSSRIRRQGYPFNTVGENIAQGGIRTAMDNWRWDGGHHRNLVNPRHSHIGPAESADASGMDLASGGGIELPIVHYKQ